MSDPWGQNVGSKRNPLIFVRPVKLVIFSQPETLVRDTCPLADASGYDRNDTTHCIEKITT